MAVTTCVPYICKKNLFDGVYLAAHTYKCALFKVGMSGTYDATTATLRYGTITGNSDEHAASGNYSAGGATVTRQAVTAAATTYLDFDDATWATATISATACMVYDDSETTTGGVGKGALILQDFGGTVSSTSATFTVAITNLLSLA